jgi:hypothetical protein
MDDHQRYWDFWNSLNQGILDMNYQAEFERIWGKGAKVEKTLISTENYDKLVEQLNQKPKPIPGLKELMNRKTPFENPND